MALAGHKELDLAIELALYEALGERIGVLLRESVEDNVGKLRERIYVVRAKLADPELARLQIRLLDLPEGPRIAIVKSAQMPLVPDQPAGPKSSGPNLKEIDL